MTQVKVITLEQIQAQNSFSDAIVVPVTPGNKIHLPGFNCQIQRQLHYLFEVEVAGKSNLEHGQTIVAREINEWFGFRNSIFIIDDLSYSISGVVFLGLKKAEESCFYSVNLPTIWDRNSVLSKMDALTFIAEQIALGVRLFMHKNKPKYLTEINLIVTTDYFRKIVNLMFVNH